MDKVHISIPEFDEAGLTYEECFRVIFVFLKHEVHHLKNIHPSESINDLDAYPLQIASRVLKTACTLHSVIERDKDYVVANTIVRTLADSIATLYLIYKSNNDELALRYYLYIMDGVKNRLNHLPQKMEYDNRIKETEFRALEKQVNESRQNYEEARQHCISQIHSMSLYKGHKHIIDELMNGCNWKFKTLGSANNKKNQYSWREMYDELKLNCDNGFFSFLGEFVNGLSTSNFIYNADTETFEPVYGTAIPLLGRLHDFINSYYSNDIPIVREKMISGLLDEGMPNHYVERVLRNTLKK